MYAFRKPFAATGWGDEMVGGLTLKSALVIGQLLGYTLAKFISIKVCSELRRERRVPFLIGLIVFAELALLLLASGSSTLQVVAMFLNGLALGSVWGVVTRYLEGRRTSEWLLAGLSSDHGHRHRRHHQARCSRGRRLVFRVDRLVLRKLSEKPGGSDWRGQVSQERPFWQPRPRYTRQTPPPGGRRTGKRTASSGDRTGTIRRPSDRRRWSGWT